ncbi:MULTISPECIES: L,D-transpeptidase family protein [unclassified Novosphingobium]|uniref:L,D-transpeptidase family protein n=1 Tax=unclassified Novosphingobium TaxID=2644732 RepID=UPI000F5F4B97|nr:MULTISPECIES: L,D-transpeptidase family protein [unclassified Novosphingobium]MBF5092871.1 L,D-transpeptidase family protein [Novosphingobium sp. NBM11]RQW44815.1 L,D-transpeptidase [Novosphingobium sp. LASN5T]
MTGFRSVAALGLIALACAAPCIAQTAPQSAQPSSPPPPSSSSAIVVTAPPPAPGSYWLDEGPWSDPVRIVVGLRRQTLAVYAGDRLIGMASVSTGRKGHSTPEGVYAILQKQKWHRSNLYSNAPMPFMQRLTWTGIALHAGHNPGHPASHGCIRMPYAFARELYDLTRIGSQVRVTMDDLAPALAVDPAAFDFGADGEVTFRFASDTYDSRIPMERIAPILAVDPGIYNLY